MNRRHFIQRTLSLAAAAAVATAASAKSAGDSALIVNGLDPSSLTVEYLEMLKAGGVHCWHQSVGGSISSFAALLEFLDEHKALIARAGTVSDIRENGRRGILSHVSGWQSAEDLIVDGQPALANLR